MTDSSNNNTILNSAKKEEEEENFENAHIYAFNDLILTIEDSPLIKKLNIMPEICLIIGKMAIIRHPIAIDYKTMILNITKKGYTADDVRYYGLMNLFLKDEYTYCSGSESGNCVDILLDMQSECTFSSFEVWSSSSGFTCPVSKAYLWVFKEWTSFTSKRSIQEIKQMAEELYAKEKFDGLRTSYDTIVIDSEMNERLRNEMIAVAFVDGGNKYGWKKKVEIGDYIKGRYILIKLIASGDTNVDAKFIGVEGYKMR